MIKRLLLAKLPLIIYNPSIIFDEHYFQSCSETGALPVFDTDYFSNEQIIKNIKTLTSKEHLFGLKVDIENIEIINYLKSNQVYNLDLVIFSYTTKKQIENTSLTQFNYKFFIEVTDININEALYRLNPDGLILKGNEAPGKVSEYTSFILMQWYLKNCGLPVFIHGGVGMYTAAGIFAAGASGIVLDNQLYLTEESPVGNNFKDLLLTATENDTTIIGEATGVQYRFFAKLGTKVVKSLKIKDSSLADNSSGRGLIFEEISKNINSLNNNDVKPLQSLFHLGQDASFSKNFKGKIKDVITKLFESINVQLEAVEEYDPLVENSPLSILHGTTFPVIQGPMANISDNPDFAKAVFDNGGLPFFAMGNLPADLSEEIIANGVESVKSFGCGLIGIETFNKTIHQHFDLVKKHKVPFALFAGGVPSQVNELEAAGTRTYLHTPNMAMLTNAVENNCKRFILEGCEAGGHVGTLTSFVLWESAVSTILEQSEDKLKDQTLIFAGGISTVYASCFITGMSSLLSKRGVKIGVQVGSVYLFTSEIVNLKSVGKIYQKTISNYNKTILTGNTVGLASRTVPTPFAEKLVEKEHKRISDGIALGERKTRFEKDNLGSLLIGAKGFLPDINGNNNGNRTTFNEQEQFENGNFLVGDSLAFLKPGLSISDVHKMYFNEKNILIDNLNSLEVFSSPTSQINDEVCIIGAGCILPDAKNPEVLWDNIISKKYSITNMPAERLNKELYFDEDKKAEDKTYTRLAGVINDFQFDNEKFGYTKNETLKLSRTQQILLETAYQAVENSGYLGDNLRLDINKKTDKAGVIIASCLGNERGNDLQLKYYYPLIHSYLDGLESFKSLSESEKEIILDVVKKGVSGNDTTCDPADGVALNAEASRIANHLGINGTSYSLDAACATSFTAIDCATKELLSGQLDMVITGGVNTNLSPEAFIGFGKMGAISAKGSWPFDDRADGFVLGEGCAVFVLKRLKDAIRDKDSVLGILKGVGSSSDGKGKAIAAPNPKGQELALNRCYEKIKTDVTVSDIDYIEAHGTSTIMGDQAEMETLVKIYQSGTPIGISSIKSQVGHLLGGAGAAGLIKVLLAIKHKTIPPNGNFCVLSKNLSLDGSKLYIVNNPKNWHSPSGKPRKAAISSYGFGGINYHAVIEEFTSTCTTLSRNIFTDINHNHNDNRVVACGIGTVLPGAETTEKFTSLIHSENHIVSETGYDCIDNPYYLSEKDPVFNLSGLKAGIVENYKFNNVKYRIPPMTAKSIEPAQLFALDAANQAIENSTLTKHLTNGNKTAVIIGTVPGKQHSENILRVRSVFIEKLIRSIPGIENSLVEKIGKDLTALIRETYPKTTEDSVPGFLSNIVSGRIANYFGCNGANFVVDSGYNSSEEAFDIAIKGLQSGDISFAITGGVDAALYPQMMFQYKAMGFCDGQKETVMGQGAAIAILTTFKTAKKLNLPILGEVKSGYKVDVKNNSATGGEKDFGWMRAAGAAVNVAKELISKKESLTDNKSRISAKMLPGYLSGEKPKAVSPIQKKTNKIIALLSGQGSQFNGMMKELYGSIEEVRLLMDKAEAVFTTIRGYSLLEIMFADDDRKNLTENTQPAVFLSTAAIFSYLKTRGFIPDVFIGHSVGEFSALYCSGLLSFDDTFKLIIKRSTLMKEAALETPGKIMVVFDNAKEVENLIISSGISDIYIANKNSDKQTAVSGAETGISAFCNYLSEKSITYTKLALSGAFHTPLFKTAALKLEDYLETITFNTVEDVKIISNVTGMNYPSDISEIKKLLVRQITSPVEFMKSVESVYRNENTTFIEIGPNKLLLNLLKNIKIDQFKSKAAVEIKNRQNDSFKNFIGFLTDNKIIRLETVTTMVNQQKDLSMSFTKDTNEDFNTFVNSNEGEMKKLLYSEYLKRKQSTAVEAFQKFDFNPGKIVVSGVSIGLPGKNKRVFDPENFTKLINGVSFIEPYNTDFKDKMVDKNVTRLQKDPDGNAKFVEITSTEDVIQLAGQLGYFDLEEEYGIKKQHDTTVSLAMAAGIEALKDANIPLVMGHKTTSTGTKMPTGFALPEEMQDGTGVILSSLWPYSETLIKEITAYYYNKFYVQPYGEFEKIYYHLMGCVTDPEIKDQITNWFFKVKERRSDYSSYKLERDFAHNITPLGSAHFAQYIKAKGPNIQMSGACASTTQAIGIAEDWIRAGRCERVIIIGGETPTSEAQSQWIGSGFLSLGAASIKKNIDEAAKPFDEKRNGTILGSGAVSLILEKEELVKKRGFNGQVEVLGTHIGNTAFHTYNIDVNGIAAAMKNFVSKVEKRHDLQKEEYSKKLVFMSHETFTPARGGSADAEITALRATYPDTCSDILISNTKGYTGHTLGAALEDAALVKVLQYRTAPPIANLSKVSENFKDLRLNKTITKGDFEYGLHIAAGFGSHLAFAFFKRIEENPAENNRQYQTWLSQITKSSEPSLSRINNTLCVEAKGEKIVNQISEKIETPVEYKRINQPQTIKTPPSTSVVTQKDETEIKITGPENPNPETSLTETIKQIIAEQTGYDLDMLEDNLDLEADLGIDTVKQVEIFGKISNQYNLKIPENLKLKDLNTISKLADYIESKVGFEINKTPKQLDLSIVTPDKPTEQTPQPSSVRAEIKNVIAEQTGYDIDMLEDNLDLEADLGIDTVKQVEIFGKISSQYNLKVPENLKLKDLNTISRLSDYIEDKVDFEVDVTTTQQEPVISEVTKQPQQPNSIKVEIKKVIAEQTGYDLDMLEDNLDLEADLGIDTVKQVEIFGKISNHYGLKVPENLKLRDLNTINKLSGYIEDKVDFSIETTTQPPEQISVETHDSVPSVTAEIKNVIAEQTGYELDMLEDNLDLEADLGIDTVKQVEIFGKISKTYSLKVPENLKLKDLNTIRKLSDYIENRVNANTEMHPIKIDPINEAKLTEPKTVQGTPLISSGVQRFVVKAVEKDLQEKLSGGFSFKDKRILVTLDNYGFAAELIKKIERAGGRPISVGNQKSAKIQVDFCDPLKTQLAINHFIKHNSQVDGLIHIAPLDFFFQNSFFAKKRTKDDERNVSLNSFFTMTKALFDNLDRPGTIISALSFNSVVFPYLDGFKGKIHPAFAGMAGMMKTINKELQHTIVKVVDFASDKPQKNISGIIDTYLTELLSVETCVESGYSDTTRYIPQLVPEACKHEQSTIEDKDTILVTGGALGITYEILKKTIEKYNANLIILGRSDIFAIDNAYLLPNVDSKAIMAKVKTDMKNAKPVEIKKAVEKIERTKTAVLNIKKLQTQGFNVVYECADVTDFPSVERVVKKHKNINGVIHAAGIEESQFIDKKEFSSFNRVTDVKVNGMNNLLKAMQNRNYRFFITFSSITARFGNEGQIDYTGANDMIGKILQKEKLKHRSRFYKIYSWTAWSGAGMAEDATVKKVLTMRGISFLPLEKGINFFLDDLNNTSDTEVVISAPDYSADTDNILAANRVVPTSPPNNLSKQFPFLDNPLSVSENSAVYLRTLSLSRDLFLFDHSMDETPVFLGSTGIETMAEAAVSLAENGKKVVEISDFSIPYGIKILKGRDKELTISAKPDEKDQSTYRCNISSVFKNPNGVVMGNPTLHYESSIKLSDTFPESPVVILPEFSPVAFSGKAEQLIYHPKRLFMDDIFKTLTGIVSFDGELLITTYKDTCLKDFFIGVNSPCFQSDVVAVDAMFQTGGLLEFFTTNSLVLPYKLASMKFFNRIEKGVEYLCLTRKTNDGSETNTYQVDLVDKKGNLFSRAKNFEMVKLNTLEDEYKISDKIKIAEKV